MLKEVTLARNSLDPSTWSKFQVEDLCAFLASEFDRFPKTAHIFHKEVSRVTDVTPFSKQDIERLQKLEGPFYVVIYPEYVALPYIFAIVIAAASYFLAPSAPNIALPPNAATRNSQAPSPNNELNDRQNRARINGRIPDIFGKVRSTPDLIAGTYRIFESNREVEYAYMCIGRGSHEVADIRDGDTLCINIPGASVEIYDPYTSPNSGDAPSTLIGARINRKVVAAKRSNSVNGQVLRPPNTFTVTGNNNIRFIPPNIVEIQGSVDFTQGFAPGDSLAITNAALTGGGSIHLEFTFVRILPDDAFAVEIGDSLVVPLFFQAGTVLQIACSDPFGTFAGGTDGLSGTYTINFPEFVPIDPVGPGYFMVVHLVNPEAHADTPAGSWADGFGGSLFEFDITATNPAASFNLNGTYTIIAVSQTQLLLDNPVAVASDWGTIDAEGTPYISPTLTSTGEKWIGPFVLNDTELTTVYNNFISENGLYEDNGTSQFALTIQVQIELTPINFDGTPRGDAEQFVTVLNGSSFVKETVGVTGVAAPVDFTGLCTVRARRITPHDESFTGQVIDEVRWRDCYSVSPVDKTNFGNITTANTKTYATASALAVKERKLNMLATRKIPTRVSGSVMTTALSASEDAADIFTAICLDEYIGKRNPAELDIPNFYDTADAIEAYFGHVNTRKFSYTFDNENLSFEETAATVASALCSVAYRRGNVIKLSFEKLTANSTLLFNHRNKLPGTESRTITFGANGDYDGIVYKYISPDDDSEISIFLPPSYAAKNPKKIDSVGIRNHLQAYFLAWRAWNRLRYQNSTTQFDATEEAVIAIRNDRILVTDGTRANIQDGEVTAVNTLELTLSQSVDLTVYSSYVIFLQLSDGTVESIDITAGSAANKVVLSEAPTIPLVTDHASFARTAYVIVGDSEPQQTAFLLDERTPNGNRVSTVKASNYDDRYYANDQDFNDDIIDENGYGPAGGFTPGTGTGFKPTSSGSPEPSGFLVPLSTFTISQSGAPFDVTVHPSGNFLYSTSEADGSVYQYAIDGTTGQLSALSPASVTSGISAGTILIHPSGNYAYVCVIDDDVPTIYQYNISSGHLSPQATPSVDSIGSSARMAITPDGQRLYACFGGGGFISQFNIFAGALSPMSPAFITSTGATDIAISPDGHVYVLDQGNALIREYTIGVGGQLTALVSPTIATGTNPTGITVSPDGTRLYVSNQADDTISQYSIGAGGVLTAVSPATASTAAEPQGLVVSPNSKNLYVTNFSANKVSQYTINSGLLAPMSPTDQSSSGHPLRIAITPDGFFVYVANVSGNTISQFSADG